MKYKQLIPSVGFFLLGIVGAYAQEAVPAAGGEATGSGGTVSYSVGQVVYTTNTGSNGSVAQGVQQPYEISVTTGIEKEQINLDFSVYPNPTKDYLRLKVDEEDLSKLDFQLFDMQGKLLLDNQLTSTITVVKMVEFPKSTYFLKVRNDKNVLKTFKIIKN